MTAPARPLPAGLVCLQGGGEFSPGCREMDGGVLALVDGPVVVAPLACASGREYRAAGENGVRYLRALGVAQVLAAPDVREQPEQGLAALAAARLLVLPGGSPSRLLGVLIGSPVGDLVRALLAAGAAVLGSSAGAMVLCAWTVLPDAPGGLRVVPGLDVVPGTLVLPHWTGRAGRERWLAEVEATAPPGTRLLGLPEESGVVLRSGTVSAVGRAAVELVGQGRILSPGQSEETG